MTIAVSHNFAPTAQALFRDSEASDERIIAMWLYGRAAHTTRAYRRAIGRFERFTGRKPLRCVTLADLQAFADTLTGKASSIAQTLAAVKSLLSFASKLGALRFNVGAALRTPKAPDGLADRILSEDEVQRMLALSEGRDHALLRLTYAGGFRISELVSLRWRDTADAADGTMYLSVIGKGSKPRTVRVSQATADILRDLRVTVDDDMDAFLFPGRSGALDPSQAWRIIRSIAKRAKVRKGRVSPHFLRHAHASHAIDRGVKITTVRDTLGHSSIAVTDRYSHARPGESSGLALAV
jgi:integrase/recombinase XerD